MAISSRKWCDFVVYTNKKVSAECITFDESHWMTMLPKLMAFYIKEMVSIIFEKFDVKFIVIFTIILTNNI